MAEVDPITPSEVAREQSKNLPDAVIEAFNQLIAQNYVNGLATVKTSEVVDLLVKKGLKRKEIFDKGWLNIEKVYQSAGWTVKYESPAYDESFDAYFEFRSSRKRA